MPEVIPRPFRGCMTDWTLHDCYSPAGNDTGTGARSWAQLAECEPDSTIGQVTLHGCSERLMYTREIARWRDCRLHDKSHIGLLRSVSIHLSSNQTTSGCYKSCSNADDNSSGRVDGCVTGCSCPTARRSQSFHVVLGTLRLS